MEEVVARTYDEDCLFTWIVPPTVIFGRNQVMENEVNTDFCTANGIGMIRRKSGGGCVYADEGNIMLSFVTPTGKRTVEEIFGAYMQRVADVLGEIDGLRGRVHVSGRTDILLDDRKISGNALYTTPDMRRTIVHGTLLHSTDIERMVRAITPSHEKLASKGIQSVRQRVMNLSEATDISIDALRRHIIAAMCDSEAVATQAMIDEATNITNQK